MLESESFEKPLGDHEYPDEDDADFGEDTVDCPACGAEVFDDAACCPVCGEYLSYGSGGVWAGRHVGWIVLGVAGVIAVIVVLIR